MMETEGIPATPGQSPDAPAGTPAGQGRLGVAPMAARRGDSRPVTARTCGYDSPLGHMTLAERNGRIVGAWFDGQKYDRANLGASRPPARESGAREAAAA